jgi:DNA invertase Pin-like site-specific DNA recombinase
VRLDRLARSVGHLLEVIEDLTAKNAHFRSLRDPIDTTTPQGMFSLQVLGAVAQLERALISERTKAGIKAAKSKGKLPGNPGIRERRPEALAKVTAAQKAAYGARIQATASQWLPTVRRMRPDHTWDDIARVLKRAASTGRRSAFAGRSNGWSPSISPMPPCSGSPLPASQKTG